MINTIDRLLARLAKREKNLWITSMKCERDALTSQIRVGETTNNVQSFNNLPNTVQLWGEGRDKSNFIKILKIALCKTMFT